MTTAIAAAATTSTSVHVVIPGFTALYEGAVNWSACGPVANEVALAALDHRKPDVGLAKAIVARDTAAGRFKSPGGQTLGDIYWDLGKRSSRPKDYIPYSGAPDLAKLHAFVKEATLAQRPVIIEVSRAYNLPDNEAGVNYHFVVLGGIDSHLGYLVANGDTRTFISTKHTWQSADEMRWATWAQLEAAGICGAIAIHPAPPPPPPPAPPPPPPDYQAEIEALKTQLSAVAGQATQALSIGQRLEAGLKAL